ncbi:TetR/AcrR family transcriptional regulator [Microbacterium sp. RD1]|uniref:TetR/AcrR family transcriptional regulator n=1 Tax=Microbacterium sp. RD1 TaxID=3457313 RepID=UPI003FA56983
MTDRLAAPRRTVATEGALLDAALAEVLAHGIRRTSASDIARRAGVSRQTLYRYWPDLQALLAALVTRELLVLVPSATTPEDLAEVVDDVVAIADRMRALPLLARLRETDPELFARYILERLGTSQRAILGHLTERFQNAQGRGIVRAGDPARLAALVLLLVQSAVQSEPLVAEWLPPEAWREELRAALTGYLRR